MKTFYKTTRTFFFASVIFSFALFSKIVGTKEKIKSRSEKGSCSLLIFVFVCFALIAGQLVISVVRGGSLAIGEAEASHYREEMTDRYRLVNLDGLGAAFGMARLEYQQNINEKSSWALRGIFWHSTTESWKWNSYGGGFSYRRYITHNAPEGGWVGGGMDVLYANAKYMGKEDYSYFVFPHAEAGYAFSFKESRWLVTPSVSLGNYIGNIEISNSNIPIMGAGMRLSVLLSYPF